MQTIRLAISAWVDVAQHRCWQSGDRHFGDVAWRREVMQQIDSGTVGQLEGPGKRLDAQVAIQSCRVCLDPPRHILAQRQGFIQHALALCLRGMDVEDEIAAGVRDVVVEVERDLEADHGGRRRMRSAINDASVFMSEVPASACRCSCRSV